MWSVTNIIGFTISHEQAECFDCSIPPLDSIMFQVKRV